MVAKKEGIAVAIFLGIIVLGAAMFIGTYMTEGVTGRATAGGGFDISTFKSGDVATMVPTPTDESAPLPSPEIETGGVPGIGDVPMDPDTESAFKESQGRTKFAELQDLLDTLEAKYEIDTTATREQLELCSADTDCIIGSCETWMHEAEADIPMKGKNVRRCVDAGEEGTEREHLETEATPVETEEEEPEIIFHTAPKTATGIIPFIGSFSFRDFLPLPPVEEPIPSVELPPEDLNDDIGEIPPSGGGLPKDVEPIPPVALPGSYEFELWSADKRLEKIQESACSSASSSTDMRGIVCPIQIMSPKSGGFGGGLGGGMI